MNARALCTRSSYRHGVALLVAVGAGLPCASVQARPGETEMMVTATIRDFPASHPDFCKSSSIGSNWVEGAIAPTLSAAGTPVYVAPGKRVTVPGRDSSGRIISGKMVQHTVFYDLPDVFLASAPTLQGTALMNTYNPYVGPYGGTNIGPVPEVSSTYTMPAVNVPSLASYIPTYLQTGVGGGTLNSSFRCDVFDLRNQFYLTIQGDVTIVCTTTFLLENGSCIMLAPGARLTVYALGTVMFQNANQVNMNTGDFKRFTLYKVGVGDVDLGNAVDVCGTIIAPNGRLYVHNDGEWIGEVYAKQMQLSNSAKLHAPEPKETLCYDVNDTPAQLGAADPGAVTGPGTFDQWFKDTPGVNEGAQARMRFAKDAAGAWEFETSDFRPIDGELLSAGQYGANRNFTLDVDGQFIYTPCTGQFLEFTCDGDAMVYVDGKLVLDLIGNNTGVTQYVDLDRLGLDPNQPHTMQFFYAQRSCSGSAFNLRTNVTLNTTYKVVSPSVACSD